MECGLPMRDGSCALDANHRGRHSTVAFYCDGCQKMRRGAPSASNEDVAFCFLCNSVSRWTNA